MNDIFQDFKDTTKIPIYVEGVTLVLPSRLFMLTNIGEY